MALVVETQTADQTVFGDDSSRRRSTFYVPLSTDDLSSREIDHAQHPSEQMYIPNLSGYSCEWSLNDDSISNDDSNRLKRYGIVLNGSVNIDDSSLEVHANHKRTKPKNLTSSTPIKDATKLKQTTICDSSAAVITSPVKEKSRTMPLQEMQIASTFPPKNSFILKSTPKMSSLSDTLTLTHQERKAIITPKKSLSFIRRTHSTKLSRNNSLLKSLTSRCVEHSNESLSVNVYELSLERLILYLKADNRDDLVKELFFRESLESSSDSCGKNHKENGDDEAFFKSDSGKYLLIKVKLETY